MQLRQKNTKTISFEHETTRTDNVVLWIDSSAFRWDTGVAHWRPHGWESLSNDFDLGLQENAELVSFIEWVTCKVIELTSVAPALLRMKPRIRVLRTT